MITDFRNKKVAIIGAGTEGIETLKYLLKQGAILTVLDQREDIHNIPELQNKDIQVSGGKDYLEGLSEFDIIVRSPGVKRTLPQLIEAEKKGVKVTSHTILFFEACPSPIIGVTGTKGKGTTSTLIYEMLKEEGLDAYLGGNIGVPPLQFIDKLKPTSWVVLELSSFQLEDMQVSPHISVMLMIVGEHLGKDVHGTQNYHESMEEYVDAKRNILRWQGPDDFAVINRDYLASHESDIHTEAKIFQVSREREAYTDGCYVKDGAVWLKKHDSKREVVKTSDIVLPGRHNLENVCAAAMAANLAGVSLTSIAKVLKTFKGLEHRLELVRDFRGVRYYDDSFSTTPETAIAAIEAFDAPEILILGGSSKNSDFTELGQLISTRVNIKAVIGIGDEWNKIKLKMKSEKLKIVEGLQSMEEVVRNAAILAEPGDVVLLSPACASFGMFKNYKERGELFKKAVQEL